MNKLRIISVLLLSCICIPNMIFCGVNQDEKSIGKNYTWRVNKTDIPPEINADWKKGIWKTVKPLVLVNFMGERPPHFPETRVKLLYDSLNIYVIFNVRDQYVRAVETELNGEDWMDSCVEFFFSPGSDTERGYFNFEANCKSVFLFKYYTGNGDISGFVSRQDGDKVKISHSLKLNVENETSMVLRITKVDVNMFHASSMGHDNALKLVVVFN